MRLGWLGRCAGAKMGLGGADGELALVSHAYAVRKGQVLFVCCAPVGALVVVVVVGMTRVAR